MKQPFEKHWKRIEAEFDWEKVHRIMTILDWGWSTYVDMFSTEVPSVKKIKEFALELCTKAYESDTKRIVSDISSGGLVAQYDKEHDLITLHFAIESDTSYIFENNKTMNNKFEG